MALELLEIDKLTVNGMGITLTAASTQEQLKAALKHRPSLSEFIVESKTKKDVKAGN